MTKKTKKAEATTLYRMQFSGELIDCIKEKYRQDLQVVKCMVGDRGAVLIHGTIGVDSPVKWSSRVERLTGIVIESKNVTVAAALLLPGEEGGGGTAWALCWGMGWLLLDASKIDAAFGQRLALRVADPQGLNSLTRKVMDERAKIDRSSIPSGEGLPGYGIGGFGEIVTRIVAKASIPGLSAGGEFRIRGADAVSLPLGLDSSSLLSDLSNLEDILGRDAPKELRVLEQLVPVRKGSDIYRQLEGRLHEEMTNPGTCRVSLAWPHEHLSENGTPESFKVKGNREREVRQGLPTAELIQDLGRRNALDHMKIQLFSDSSGESPISTDIPLRKWIALETTLEERRYFLHDGQWFSMDTDYAAHLDRRVADIFDRPSGVPLPPWSRHMNEESYNRAAAQQLKGRCLDRKLIRTTQSRRGFEASDILLQDGTYIHIKGANSSAPLSHLFAQGANSAHAVQYDEEARKKLGDLVRENGGDPAIVATKPQKVVFGVFRRRSDSKFDEHSLYSFSKVTLVRVFDELEGRGIEVRVCPIDAA